MPGPLSEEMRVGFLLALLSSAFSAAKDLVSKKLAFRLHGTASTFASFAYALPFYLLLLAVLVPLGVEKISLSLGFLFLVFLRSLTDALAEGLKMHAFAHADISLVSCFFSLSPLFLLITSPLLTGDRLSWQAVLAVLLVVVGSIALVYRPSHKGWAIQKKGLLLACAAAVFFSLNSCFDRLTVEKIGTAQKGTPVFAGFAMTLLSALFLLPLIAHRRDHWKTMYAEGRGLWLRGLLEVAFMACKLSALQYLSAPLVVAVQRSSLLLSIVGGRVFFREQDFARRLVAGIVILGGVIVVALDVW